MDSTQHIANSSVADDHTVTGKKVTVLGAARSGVAAAELITLHGAKLFVSDQAPAEKLVDQVAKLKAASASPSKTAL